MCEDTYPEGFKQKDVDLICLNPDKNACEIFSNKKQICFDDANLICINWELIIWAIIISNSCQIIFEAAFAYSIELTINPTNLDKMIDPDKYEDDNENQASNPDQKIEPNCAIVMSKCWTELLAILIYFSMVVIFSIGLLH